MFTIIVSTVMICLICIGSGVLITVDVFERRLEAAQLKTDKLEEQNRKLALALLDAQKEGLLTIEEADESRAERKQLLKEINPAPNPPAEKKQLLEEFLVAAARRADPDSLDARTQTISGMDRRCHLLDGYGNTKTGDY